MALDLRVHVKSAKSGKVIEKRPYRLHIENRIRMFEVPAGSGKFFFENGDEVPKEQHPRLAPIKNEVTRAQEIERLQSELRAAQQREQDLQKQLKADPKANKASA